MALYRQFLVIVLACLINLCYGYQFYVGGRDGWVPDPSENYIHWAERMRFQVNDTLVFRYKKGTNSVLVVNKDDYDKCNTNNPIKKMDDGNSIFKFDHSGPFYFISGNKNDCENGSQKLITVVLAIRPPPPPSPRPFPPSPPSTPGKSPATSPVVSPTPSVSPATPPVSQSPGNAPSPATSPSVSPSVSPATPPVSQTPASPPGLAPSPATPSSPTTSPATPSPTIPSTPGVPGTSPPGGGVPSPAGGGNNPPADIQSPKGSKNSAVKAVTTTTVVLVSI
ncbi:putative phenylalanine--tRNA ligase alpha subunit-like, partial [Capsicum annuum]